MKPKPLLPAARRGLAEQTADLIREAVLSGGFAPGEALREVELAAMLEVSRGSVREGLATLETEGLVTRTWHQGTTVIDISRQDVIDIYAVRAALDRLAAITAKSTATRHDLRDLNDLVDAMDTAVARGAAGPELLALDMAFHDQIYAIARNARLVNAWRTIRSQIHFFQLRRVEHAIEQYRAHIVGEHRNFVELLRDAPITVVGQEAEAHVHTALGSLLATSFR